MFEISSFRDTYILGWILNNRYMEMVSIFFCFLFYGLHVMNNLYAVTINFQLLGADVLR